MHQHTVGPAIDVAARTSRRRNGRRTPSGEVGTGRTEAAHHGVAVLSRAAAWKAAMKSCLNGAGFARRGTSRHFAFLRLVHFSDWSTVSPSGPVIITHNPFSRRLLANSRASHCEFVLAVNVPVTPSTWMARTTYTVPAVNWLWFRRSTGFALSGAAVGTHRTDQRRAALRAGVSDVFKIAACSAIGERRGFDIRDRHPLSAMWTREDETRQVRRGDVHVTHGTLTVPIPPRHFATDLWNESTNTKVYASCIAGAGAGAGR